MMDAFTVFLQFTVSAIIVLIAYAHYRGVPIFKKPIVKYGLPILMALLIAPMFY